MPIIQKPDDAIQELVQHRTERSKLFDLGNGMQKVIHCLGKVHYTDDLGSLQDIELTTEIEAGTGDIVANKVPYRFRLHKNGIGMDYQSRADGGTATVKLSKIGNKVFSENQAYPFTLQGNRIIFADVDTDLDIHIEIGRFGVRTHRILKSAAADRSWQWEVETNDAGDGKFRDGSIAGEDADGKVTNVTSVSSAKSPKVKGKTKRTATETWNGEVQEIDPVTRIKSWGANVTYPVAIDPDITETIAADADDGHEKVALGWYSAVTLDNFGKYSVYYHPAWRFTTVAVAQGTTIILAELKINAISSTIGGGGGTLYGYDVDSAAALSSTVKPTTMAKTTATATVAQSTSTGVRTYNVTSIVQEIINRGSWVSNNNLTLFGIGTSGGYNRTRFEDYSNLGTSEAKLEITTTVSSMPLRDRAHQPQHQAQMAR